MTGEPISAAELRRRLSERRTVQAEGVAFHIRRVPPLFLAEENEDFWALARQGALAGRAAEIAASPKLAQLRRILLYGVVHPRLSMGEKDPEAVPVDELIANGFELAARLYSEIIVFTFERIPGTAAGPAPGPGSAPKDNAAGPEA